MKITPHGRMWEATPHRCMILHIEEACLLQCFSRFVVKSPDSGLPKSCTTFQLPIPFPPANNIGRQPSMKLPGNSKMI